MNSDVEKKFICKMPNKHLETTDTSALLYMLQVKKQDTLFNLFSYLTVRNIFCLCLCPDKY